MSDQDRVIVKLEQLEQKMDKIETAVELIAVQSERINNISGQVNSLWKKYDAAFAPNGVINKITQFQAACPLHSIQTSVRKQDFMIKGQWCVIGLLITILSSKILGLF